MYIDLVTNCVKFSDKLHRENDPSGLHQADDEGDGPYQEQVVSHQAGELVGAAGVVNITGMVSHAAQAGDCLATGVGNLTRYIRDKARQLCINLILDLYL